MSEQLIRPGGVRPAARRAPRVARAVRQAQLATVEHELELLDHEIYMTQKLANAALEQKLRARGIKRVDLRPLKPPRRDHRRRGNHLAPHQLAAAEQAAAKGRLFRPCIVAVIAVR